MGETAREIQRILSFMHDRRQTFLSNRKRIRMLSNERQHQKTCAQLMLAAIKAKDFIECMRLVQNGGISIDTETPEGFTVLLSAAEENSGMVNHTYMRNDENKPCLAVAYLLDREYYRPTIDLEARVSGHTALIRASILSRADVVEALLDRGADINYINRFGRTALHYTAGAGRYKHYLLNITFTILLKYKIACYIM